MFELFPLEGPIGVTTTYSQNFTLLSRFAEDRKGQREWAVFHFGYPLHLYRLRRRDNPIGQDARSFCRFPMCSEFVDARIVFYDGAPLCSRRLL